MLLSTTATRPGMSPAAHASRMDCSIVPSPVARTPTAIAMVLRDCDNSVVAPGRRQILGDVPSEHDGNHCLLVRLFPGQYEIPRHTRRLAPSSWTLVDLRDAGSAPLLASRINLPPRPAAELGHVCHKGESFKPASHHLGASSQIASMAGCGHLDILGKPVYRPPRMSTRADHVALLQGTLDLLILRTLRSGPAHGHAIAKAIEQTSESVLQVEQGSLYPALHRLLKRGWIVAADGVSENNRRAKFYRLTTKGKSQLSVETGKWEKLVSAIARILQSDTARQP